MLSTKAGKVQAGSLGPVARTCSTSKPLVHASHLATRTAEIHIRVALMNRFNALGTAEVEPVA